jgi:type III secretory pathway component EscV
MYAIIILVNNKTQFLRLRGECTMANTGTKATKKIKLYDVKKIKYKDTEFVGMLIEQEYEGYGEMKFLQLDSSIRHLWFKSANDYTVTAVRLAPKVREQFDKTKAEYQNYDKLIKEIKALRLKISAAETKVNKAKENLANASGLISRENFDKKVEEIFKNSRDNIDRKSDYCYVTSSSDDTISVGFETIIEKYADADSYSFIDREYDGTLWINDSDKNAKATVKKFMANRLNLKKKLKDIEFSTDGYLDIGDKNTLMYTHQITIKFT